MPHHDSDLPGRFQVRHWQNTCELAHLPKVGTTFRTLVRDQNFLCVVRFEPELSWCGKGFCGCHVLPACSLPGGNVSRDKRRAIVVMFFLRSSGFLTSIVSMPPFRVTLWQGRPVLDISRASHSGQWK